MTKEKPIYSKQKEGVKAMFDAIAPSYDLLNHLLSLGIDKKWRKLLTQRLADNNPQRVIDVATGTADLALMISQRTNASVTGIDISPGMIAIGQKKVFKHSRNKEITLLEADSASLPFPDHYFDAATVAFGVRNFENTVAGLTEMARIIKPGGKIFVLEFSTPRGAMGFIARFYMRRIMPLIGAMISGHATAYRYLPETALTFPEGKEFTALLSAARMEQATITPLTFGIATLYEAIKPLAK